MAEQKKVVVKKSIQEIKFVGDYTPQYATEGSACFDLEVSEKTRIQPGEFELVDLGIKMEIPKGYYVEIVPRSSICKSGLVLANSVGVIDSDFRGSIKAPLRNVTDKKIIVLPGSHLVQAMLKPIIKFPFKKVSKLSETARGEGGFGSTGK